MCRPENVWIGLLGVTGMPTESPTLQDVLALYSDTHPQLDPEHLAAELDRLFVVTPRAHTEITTVEQLDALPDFTIVGLPMPSPPSDVPEHLLAIEKEGDDWFGVGGGNEFRYEAILRVLKAAQRPAMLLWHPAWRTPEAVR